MLLLIIRNSGNPPMYRQKVTLLRRRLTRFKYPKEQSQTLKLQDTHQGRGMGKGKAKGVLTLDVLR